MLKTYKRITAIWQKLIGEVKLFASISLILTFLGLFASVFSIIIGIKTFNQYYINIDEIPVGIGPFYTKDKDQLELKYISMYKDINDYFRDRNIRYRFYPIVSKDSYANLYKDLEDNGTIKIASISPVNYLLYKNNLLSHKPKDFTLLGYKHVGSKTTYRSRMIWNKKELDWKEIIEILRKTQNKFIQEDSSLIILTEEERSTSCHVIPEIFLLENGIDLKKTRHKSLNRPQMIEKLSDTSKLHISFLSDEDYIEQLSDGNRNNLAYYDLEIPIPYDVFIANTKWWNKLRRNKEKILDGLKSSSYGMIWDSEYYHAADNYDIFALYVGSGIVINDTTVFNKIVVLPDKQFDILHIRDSISSKSNNPLPVKLISFNISNINASYSTLDTIELGSATLCKNYMGNYYLTNQIFDTLRFSNIESIKNIHIIQK